MVCLPCLDVTFNEYDLQLIDAFLPISHSCRLIVQLLSDGIYLREDLSQLPLVVRSRQMIDQPDLVLIVEFQPFGKLLYCGGRISGDIWRMAREHFKISF